MLHMSQWPTESEIRKLCSQWQEMLRLQNWKIKIRYARIRDMIADDGNIAWGRCSLSENHLTAKVQILHPDDYEDDEGRYDIEATIVHELLHVLMDGIRRDGRDEEGFDRAALVAEEQAINVASELLVSLSRNLYEALQGNYKPQKGKK